MKKGLLISLVMAVVSLAGCGNQQATQPAKPATKPTTNVSTKLTAVAPVRSCSSLMNVDMTAIAGQGSKIDSAKTVKDQNGQSVCQIEGTLYPTIGFKVTLPEKTWTQRFLQLGCGGLCGHVDLIPSAADKCSFLDNSQFVLSSTDMGHEGNSSEFGRDPQKRIDFAYRSVHLTALASKALIKAYYGQAQKYAYFNGCSDGGREALMEAQRFPDDFDGIVAGAPAMNFSVQNSMHHGWLALANQDAAGNAILHADDMPILHKAVLEQCDALDGLKDGLISDPRACHFDPSVVQCKKGQFKDCLTKQQVNAAKKIYAGPHDPVTGEALALGAPMPGSEMAWTGVFVPQEGSNNIFSVEIALGALKTMLYTQNPPKNYTLHDLKFTEASFNKLRPLYGMYSSTNPDLRPFKDHGGKLILWHGWADQHISPMNSIAYYEAVKSFMGKKQQDEFMRFYLVPGMYHCFGGEGPHSFDMISAVMKWVEHDKAPFAIMASQGMGHEIVGGGAPEKMKAKDKAPGANVPSIQRTRPLYPFPLVAVYKGHGDVNSASSFTYAEGYEGPATYKWAGADVYEPGNMLDCHAVAGKLVCKPIAQK